MNKYLYLLCALVSSSVHADYNVKISIERPDKAPIFLETDTVLNETVDVSAKTQVEYVGGTETVTKWYHSLLGIKPTPKIIMAPKDVGYDAQLSLDAYQESNDLVLAFKGKLVEVFDFDTTKYDLVEGLATKQSTVDAKVLVQVRNGKGCVEPFISSKDYKINVCVREL
ncbi:hypothetical protein L1D14_07415 [Vibrio tubiashii]|uniref:hypothetical protein n=1 Tax=Vibrio tubiashii TaxID=29498 RepID=UPI001EFE95FC|nr:hypothetical protein [Vibrio tubiashii]MCG9576066.1 hypothetical protein [Vibrio tubiashii]